MKGFATTTFLSSFDRLQRAGETAPDRRRWTSHGLAWSRDRHAFYGGDYSVSLEIVKVSSPGPKPWTLIVVREGWWVQDERDPIKVRKWSHFVQGDRAKALSDFGRLFDAL